MWITTGPPIVHIPYIFVVLAWSMLRSTQNTVSRVNTVAKALLFAAVFSQLSIHVLTAD